MTVTFMLVRGNVIDGMSDHLAGSARLLSDRGQASRRVRIAAEPPTGWARLASPNGPLCCGTLTQPVRRAYAFERQNDARVRLARPLGSAGLRTRGAATCLLPIGSG